MNSHDRRSRLPSSDRALDTTMRVVARHQGWAFLDGVRASACASCAVKSSCGAGALAAFGPSGRPQLRVPENVPGEIGDEVVVSMSGEEFVKLTFLTYLLPPIALAAVATVSPLAGLGDVATAALCVPAFLLSFLPLWLIERSGHRAAMLKVGDVAMPINQTKACCSGHQDGRERDFHSNNGASQ